MQRSTQKALLVLENGMIFHGTAFGDTTAEAEGEVVFNTAMTGYQEIITDPSYKGQLITFTYPHIGNYGVNVDDDESAALQAEGMIVREYAKAHSNWRSAKPLGEYLQENNKIGIEGIDTRKLVRVLREGGAMRGIISATETNADKLLERVKDLPSMEGQNLADGVSTEEQYEYDSTQNVPLTFPASQLPADGQEPFKVAAIDFGVKTNILRRLAKHGCDVTVFPSDVSAEAIKAFQPDGIFLSNGPGDPAAVEQAVATIKELIGETPMFGICLGHQLLSLAFGATTYKLKFGHRGANHPVKNIPLNRIEITSQNHGFAVDRDSMSDDLELTHVNLNDNTVSGFRHKTLPIFCVQYHPEASPGPHDSDYLFGEFMSSMEQRRNVLA
jgi:carbamoyl-phosphate synthase small subunit